MTSLVVQALGFGGSVLGNGVASFVGKRHYERLQTGECGQDKEIFDAGHAVIPQIDVNPILHTLVDLFWVPFLVFAGKSQALAVGGDVSIRFAALVALRTIANVVTILPKSDQKCKADTWTWRELVAGQCYDKLFSGHAAFAVLISLSMVSRGVWPSWLGWSYPSIMALVLLVSRGHYTVDIVLGVALAYLSWHSTLF